MALCEGSRGPAVRRLQVELKALGYYDADIDSRFGPRTLEAVCRFQGDTAHLLVDGRVGPCTRAALDQALVVRDAALASHEMGKLRAEATADPGAVEGLKTLRDQAYTYLKEAVDEVRACGQYVFWRTPDRRDGYASAYMRRQNSSRKTASEPTPAE